MLNVWNECYVHFKETTSTKASTKQDRHTVTDVKQCQSDKQATLNKFVFFPTRRTVGLLDF